jgi:hypothetical protein
MPLMEAFEQGDKGQSRYVFVPKPGKHGHVLNAVAVNANGTTRLEIKASSKTELAKKAALLEKALGKTAKQDHTQEDGSFTRVFIAATELKSLSSIIPKSDLDAAIVEAIRHGLIVPETLKGKRREKRALNITVDSISDRLPA